MLFHPRVSHFESVPEKLWREGKWLCQSVWRPSHVPQPASSSTCLTSYAIYVTVLFIHLPFRVTSFSINYSLTALLHISDIFRELGKLQSSPFLFYLWRKGRTDKVPRLETCLDSNEPELDKFEGLTKVCESQRSFEDKACTDTLTSMSSLVSVLSGQARTSRRKRCIADYSG